MWSYTKHYIADDIDELKNAVLDSLPDQRDDKRLKKSFLRTAQLHLPIRRAIVNRKRQAWPEHEW